MVRNISGTNAFTTQSGVAKNVCGKSSINTGSTKCKSASNVILIHSLPVEIRLL